MIMAAAFALSSLYNGLMVNNKSHVAEKITATDFRKSMLTDDQVLASFALCKKGVDLGFELPECSVSAYAVAKRLPHSISLKMYYKVFNVDVKNATCSVDGAYSWLRYFPVFYWELLMLEFGPNTSLHELMQRFSQPRVHVDCDKFGSDADNGGWMQSLLGYLPGVLRVSDSVEEDIDKSFVVDSVIHDMQPKLVYGFNMQPKAKAAITCTRVISKLYDNDLSSLSQLSGSVRFGGFFSDYGKEWSMVYRALPCVTGYGKKLLLVARHFMHRDLFITGNNASKIYAIDDERLDEYLLSRYKSDNVYDPFPYGYCWNNGFRVESHLKNMRNYKPVMGIVEVVNVVKTDYSAYIGSFSFVQRPGVSHFLPAKDNNIPYIALLTASVACEKLLGSLPSDIHTWGGMYRFVKQSIAEPVKFVKLMSDISVCNTVISFSMRDQNGGALV